MNKIVIAGMLMSVAFFTQAGGDPTAGEAKSAACQACHGARGKASVPVYPNLAGQNEKYLLLALQAYQKGERNGGQAEVMKAFVAGLSETDMENLSAWYATLPP